MQTITPRTDSGNIKVLVMIDVSTGFVRAIAMPNENAETIARELISEWIGAFGPMHYLLTDGPNLAGKCLDCLVEQLGVGRMKTYPLHPQTNGTVERWNCTLARDLASFMTPGCSIHWRILG